jgi:hypothetical protein
MAIRSRAVKPVTITNTNGQPEIVLEINGMTISMTPPAADGSHAVTTVSNAPAPADVEREAGGPA